MRDTQQIMRAVQRPDVGSGSAMPGESSSALIVTTGRPHDAVVAQHAAKGTRLSPSQRVKLEEGLKIVRIRVQKRMETALRKVHAQVRREDRNTPAQSCMESRGMITCRLARDWAQARDEGYQSGKNEMLQDLRGSQSKHDEVVRHLESMIQLLRTELDTGRANHATTLSGAHLLDRDQVSV